MRKSVLAGVLACTMLLGTAGAVFASDSTASYTAQNNSEAEQKSMLAALTTVKQRIEIPEELTEFSYDYTENELASTFRFTWSAPANENYSCLSISITDGIITGYNYFGGKYDMDYADEEHLSIGALTPSELYKKAEKELMRINPTLKNRIRLQTEKTYANIYSDHVTIPVTRVFKGIPVENDRGVIRVNKDTGELVSFSLSWHPNASFKLADEAISVTEAEKAYAEMIDLEPVYSVEYDYETQTYSTQLYYRQTDWGEINAFTGEKSDFIADGYFTDDNAVNGELDSDEAAPEAGDKGSVSFTDAELTELENKEKLITAEKLAEIMDNIEFFCDMDGMEPASFDIRTKKVNDSKRYIINAYYNGRGYSESDGEIYPIEYDKSDDYSEDYYVDNRNVYVTADAETGEIISYSFYKSDSSVSNTDRTAEAEKKLVDIAKTLAGDKYSEYRLNNIGSSSWEESDMFGNPTGIVNYYSYYAHFDRYVNGIKVENDSMSLTLNADDLSLSDYFINHTFGVDFISTKNMLSESAVIKKIWKQTELDLYYKARTIDGKTRTVLVYGCDSALDCNAITGELVYGRYADEIPEYSDISGEFAEKVEHLLFYGIGFDDKGGKFSPDTAITAYEFTSFLGGVSYLASDSDGVLNRAEAVKMLVSAIYGDSVAKMTDIFKAPFSDVPENSEYVGYIAIAKASSLIPDGDTFNPDGAFTRKDAVEIIYDYLSA